MQVSLPPSLPHPPHSVFISSLSSPALPDGYPIVASPGGRAASLLLGPSRESARLCTALEPRFTDTRNNIESKEEESDYAGV